MKEKEEITNIIFFPKKPDVRVRVIEFGDSQAVIENKKDYPFKLYNSLAVCVQTTKRNFSFTIQRGFTWNGADIPPFLWLFTGSRTSNEFLIGSMLHDYLLNNKYYMMNEVIEGILPNEYRRLTSLIFREILKANGTIELKANIMSFFVDCWQRIVFLKNKLKGIKKNG